MKILILIILWILSSLLVVDVLFEIKKIHETDKRSKQKMQEVADELKKILSVKLKNISGEDKCSQKQN